MGGAQAQSMLPTCSGKRTDLCKDLKGYELPGSDGGRCITYRCLGDYQLLEHTDYGLGVFFSEQKGLR